MAAFRKVLSNRPVIGAVFYIALLYIFEECLFDFPQAKLLRFAMSFLSQDGKLIVLASSSASYVFFWFVVWVIFRSSRRFQVLYVFLFALSSLVQYGYWKAVDRFLLPADLKIATATPLNTWMSASELFFDWRFIVPVIVLTCFLILFSERETWKPSFIKFGYVILSLVGLTAVQILMGNHLNLGLSFSSFCQTITRSVVDTMTVGGREILQYHHPDAPQNNIVLVIDESIRGDHLGINGYERETTPFLEVLASREEGFRNFGLAVAGATCSYSSNALILTGVRPGLDEFEFTARYPTIFQYAKAMGYKTYYMDAQTNSLWNGLTDRDISFIDSWFKARDFGNNRQSDFLAADRIAEIVSTGTGNFIVLNKRGVHFLYESSYPIESAVWLPLPEDYESHPELVSNAYDNGVLYNVNTFFERLLVKPEILEKTTILYTSDHGQTLFENQASWLHCNYTSQEATVPMIIIGRNLPLSIASNHTRHSSIFPTVLDLMAVPASERIHTYSDSLFSLTEDSTTDRFFFDGRLNLIRFPDS